MLDVNAEIAFSKPDPNRSGEAYLEEFESEAGLQVPHARDAVGVRQRAAGGRGPGGHRLRPRFDPADAVALIWQNLVPISPPILGPIELRPQDIDPLIRLAGRGELPEAVLYTTLHADTAGGIVQRTTPPAGLSRDGTSLRDGARW